MVLTKLLGGRVWACPDCGGINAWGPVPFEPTPKIDRLNF